MSVSTYTLKYKASAFPGDNHHRSVVCRSAWHTPSNLSHRILKRRGLVLRLNKIVNILLINITTNILKWNYLFILFILFFRVYGGEEYNYYNSWLPHTWFVLRPQQLYPQIFCIISENLNSLEKEVILWY